MKERLTEEQLLNWGSTHTDAWIASAAVELISHREVQAVLATALKEARTFIARGWGDEDAAVEMIDAALAKAKEARQ